MIIAGLSLKSIRGRLWFGFGVLVAMLVVAGIVARTSFAGISETITQSLAEVQEESQLASALSADQDPRLLGIPVVYLQSVGPILLPAAAEGSHDG